MSPGAPAIIGAAGVLVAMSTLGLIMSRRVRSGSDFMVAGGRANAVMVGGVIAGTVVGGGSTLGATELAFACGWSGAAYAIGASAGCLILGSLFAARLRSLNMRTIPELIGRSYGKSAALASAVTSAASVLVTLVAQFIAATSLLTSFFGASRPLAAALTALVMLAYVLGGGWLGTAVLGVVKLALLYATLAVCAAVVVWSTPASGVMSHQDAASALVGCARSFMTDVDSVLALFVGMLSTQIYIQSLSAGATDRAARRGAYLCAVFVLPTAVATVLIGGFMRHQFPAIEPVRALPTFIMTFITPWLAGGMLAVLLVTTIGSGAGLLLGITTTLTRDVALAVWPERLTDRGLLQISRVIMIGVLVVAHACATTRAKDMILTWIFLGFGLRGAALLVPLVYALYDVRRRERRDGLVAICLPPAVMLVIAVSTVTTSGVVYWGLAVSLGVLLVGSIHAYRRSAPRISTMVPSDQ